LLASPPGLSQRATSFIASQCQGIHQMPLITRLSTTPNGKDQTALRQCRLVVDAANFSLEDTCWAQPTCLLFSSRDAITGMPDVPSSVTLHTRYSPIQSAKRNGSVITSVANSELLTELLQTPSPPPSHQRNGGGERDRTDDLLLAKQALSQLSYTPGSGRHFCHLSRGRMSGNQMMVGQGGFEPPTSRLSSARSNQLSY
jgi:hypothetical protein